MRDIGENPHISCVRLSRDQREYIKSRLPIMPLEDIADHLDLHITELRGALRKCGIFMAAQLWYNPDIVYCPKCGHADFKKRIIDGACKSCRLEAKEMRKIDISDSLRQKAKLKKAERAAQENAARAQKLAEALEKAAYSQKQKK